MMQISDELLAISSWLANPSNLTLIRAENNPECLEKVALSLVAASHVLKLAAEEIVELEKETPITPESLEELAAIATEFDRSEDEMLIRQASVLDNLLLIMGKTEDRQAQKKAEDDRLEELKKKYRDTLDRQKEMDGIRKAEKAIEKSPVMKTYRNNEFSLSTRYCPIHSGVSVHRVGEHTVQCPVDGKVYNWEAGFKTEQGNTVPPGNVQGQGAFGYSESYTPFNSEDSRNNRNGYNSQNK